MCGKTELWSAATTDEGLYFGYSERTQSPVPGGGEGGWGGLILLSWPTKVTAPGVTASLRADKPSDARPDVSRAGRLTSQTIGQSDRKAKHDKKRGALRVNLCETSRAAARRQRSPFAVRASAERRVDSQ